jgi:glycosyltransferase involved in cell wall biosynthesis
MSPSLSVVICSLNGAKGVQRCLRALRAQTIRSELELIVVDDGSTDATSDAAHAGGAIVIRHARRRGAAAARNSGITIASAPVVAFLDDDCEPLPEWAETLLAAYEPDVIALGGALIVGAGPGLVLSFLTRHNPLLPQELELTKNNKIAYRFLLYIQRQWAPVQRCDRRDVAILPTANMAVRRQALLEVGGFDERIDFGSEDDDLCRRLLHRFPAMRLTYEPEAKVIHHFEPSLRDTLQRCRTYGRGSAMMYRKWPDVPPTIFPFPALELALLVFSFRFPALIAVAVLLPHVFYPAGLRAAVSERNALCLLDAYLQLAQETCDNVGFVEGLWHYRNFAAEPALGPIRPAEAE